MSLTLTARSKTGELFPHPQNLDIQRLAALVRFAILRSTNMLISRQCVQPTLFLKHLNEAKKIYTSRKDRQYHACLTLVATALV